LISYGIFINFHVIELPRKVKTAISGTYVFCAELIIGKMVEKVHVAWPINWKATVKFKLVLLGVFLKALFL